MREKIFNIINKVYGVVMMISFFAGVLPIIPFILALIIGGEAGEVICTFIYNQYYPWVIAGASISVLIGLIGMYVGGLNKSSKKKREIAKKEDDNKAVENEQPVEEQKIEQQ